MARTCAARCSTSRPSVGRRSSSRRSPGSAQLRLASNDLRMLFGEVCRVALELLDVDVAHVLALQGDGSLAYAAKLGLGDVSQGTAIAAGQDSIVREALENSGLIVV